MGSRRKEGEVTIAAPSRRRLVVPLQTVPFPRDRGIEPRLIEGGQLDFTVMSSTCSLLRSAEFPTVAKVLQNLFKNDLFTL